MTQRDLARLLEVNVSRVNEYIAGKREPTHKVAKRMYQKLDIDADIILGWLLLYVFTEKRVFLCASDTKTGLSLF